MFFAFFENLKKYVLIYCLGFHMKIVTEKHIVRGVLGLRCNTFCPISDMVMQTSWIDGKLNELSEKKKRDEKIDLRMILEQISEKKKLGNYKINGKVW